MEIIKVILTSLLSAAVLFLLAKGRIRQEHPRDRMFGAYKSSLHQDTMPAGHQ